MEWDVCVWWLVGWERKKIAISKDSFSEYREICIVGDAVAGKREPHSKFLICYTIMTRYKWQPPPAHKHSSSFNEANLVRLLLHMSRQIPSSVVLMDESPINSWYGF